MTTLVRWVVVALLVCHGLIHLLGVVKGFGWADVSPLKEPISPGGGVIWLLAAVLVLGSAGFIALGAPTWWWAVAVLGAMVSQVAVTASWSDAKAGTIANLALVLAAVYGFASLGPTASFRAQWHERAAAALDSAPTHGTRLSDRAGPGRTPRTTRRLRPPLRRGRKPRGELLRPVPRTDP